MIDQKAIDYANKLRGTPRLCIGDKILDLEEKVWGIVWRVNHSSSRCRVWWFDGSLTLGLHLLIINEENGYRREYDD
jgi:hypothetical protein